MSADFLGNSDLTTLAGASVAVVIVTNTTGVFIPVVGYRYKWGIALVLSSVVVGTLITPITNIVLFVVNSCLLFTSALGTNEVAKVSFGGNPVTVEKCRENSAGNERHDIHTPEEISPYQMSNQESAATRKAIIRHRHFFSDWLGWSR